MLVSYIDEKKSVVMDKNIVEMGSGTGYVGIAAALYGAKHVLVTDVDTILPLLQRNLAFAAQQHPKLHDTLECQEFNW